MLIDSFLYYSEPAICALRMQYLEPYVDRFVVVEADRSFTMQPHESEFPNVIKQMPKRVQKKTVYEYVHIDESAINHLPLKDQGRYVEIICRQRSKELILEQSSNGIVAMSDVDEIWDTRYLNKALEMIEQSNKMCWVQEYRVCFIDWVGKLGGWPGTKMGKLETFAQEEVMQFYCSTNKSWGCYSEFLEHGWHLTIMGNQLSKTTQISAKRETPGWEEKVGKNSEQISPAVWSNGWNTVVKKAKMKAYNAGVDNLDPAMVRIAKTLPELWSNGLDP